MNGEIIDDSEKLVYQLQIGDQIFTHYTHKGNEKHAHIRSEIRYKIDDWLDIAFTELIKNEYTKEELILSRIKQEKR